MRTTEKGIELIKYFEGLHLNAYQCPSGIWTIGWGHTKNVIPGMKIDIQKAEILLKFDIEEKEMRVNELIRADLLNKLKFYEYDALISLAFNLRYNSLVYVIKNRLNINIELFKRKLLQYCYVNGKILKGLKIRRICERLLFENREWKIVAKNLQQEKVSIEDILKIEQEIFDE